VSERLLAAAEFAARYGCPLVAAAHCPERRVDLMALNAELEAEVPIGSTEAGDRVRRALEDVLRARVRRARMVA
jgi:hypothetical protein